MSGIGSIGPGGAARWNEAEGPEAAAQPADAGGAGRGAAVARLPFGRAVRVAEIGPGPKKLPEASGVAFHRERGTLFLVGDRGHVAEVTRDGDVLRKRRVEHLDLEGVTVGPGGRVYAVKEEKPPEILEIDPDTLEVLRSFKVDVREDGERLLARHGNQGLEGLCWVESEGAFYALNEDRPAAIVKLAVPLDRAGGGKAKIEAVLKIGSVVADHASDLAYDAASGHFLVTESGRGAPGGARVHEITRAGDLVRTVPLPARRAEGLTLDDRGAAFIAQDGGKLLRAERG
jgi:uncharacterized protein YjiK